MARPKEFDSETLVHDAMNVFWKSGYTATSMNDLIAETGVNRGSLYGAFKDKRHLFLAALERYDRERWGMLQSVLSQPGSVRQLLSDWIRASVESCTGDDGRRGCLLAKAAMELVPDDPEMAAFMRRVSVRNEKFLAEVILRGQKNNEITSSLDARIIARFLWASLAGLRFFGATSPTAREMREVVEVVLRVLD